MENDRKQLLENRENLYRFLGRIYMEEVDETLLQAMKQMAFPKEHPQDTLMEGGILIENYLNRDDSHMLEDLAVDYARVFLSAGIAQGHAAFPYESVYTSRKHLMMQEAQNQAAAFYAAKGLEPGEKPFRVPEDHIGYELEFMAYLCSKERDETRCQCSLEEQIEFLKSHLLNWVFTFTAELFKYAETDFYKGIAKVTKGFLELERDWLTGN